MKMINLAFKLKPEGCSISYFKKYTMEDSCPLYTAAACLTRLCSVGRSCDAVAFHLAFIEFLICAATHKFWLVCVLSSSTLCSPSTPCSDPCSHRGAAGANGVTPFLLAPLGLTS